MSERYDTCPTCAGTGYLFTSTLSGDDRVLCGGCEGTGFDGSIEALERRKDTPSLLRTEDKTPMDKAIQAVQDKLNKRNL